MCDPHARLLRLLRARAGEEAVLLAGGTTPWSSVTFAGLAHRWRLRLSAAGAARLLDGLEEAELPIPGHIVADMACVARHLEGDALVVEIAGLTVEAG